MTNEDKQRDVALNPRNAGIEEDDEPGYRDSGGETSQDKKSERRRALLKQSIRYVLVGCSSFALEFLLFVVFHELLIFHVVLSNVLAITGSSIFNFSMSRSWTFKSTSSILRSVILYLLLFCWNQFFSSWVIVFLVDLDLSAMIAKIITMAIIVCWNFVLYRKVVFV